MNVGRSDRSFLGLYAYVVESGEWSGSRLGSLNAVEETPQLADRHSRVVRRSSHVHDLGNGKDGAEVVVQDVQGFGVVSDGLVVWGDERDGVLVSDVTERVGRYLGAYLSDDCVRDVLSRCLSVAVDRFRGSDVEVPLSQGSAPCDGLCEPSKADVPYGYCSV